MFDFSGILSAIQAFRDLSRQEMSAAIEYMLSGSADENLVRQILSSLAAKGETVDELVGAALAMRAAMRRISSAKRPVLDTCGTGGDGSKTFNISTAAALALAATGVPVAKHGNRKITSSTGSADVLAELGLNLDAPPEVVQGCLDDVGICFCFAPLFHPAMKHVAAVRRQLGHPTIFNRLGPLANPAGAECQVLGVGDAAMQDMLALALQALGTQRSLVVRGQDGVDEISISAATRVLEVTPHEIREHLWTAEDFGVRSAPRTELWADDPASSAACIRRILQGQRGACRDVVVMNAAAALWLVQSNLSLADCAQKIAAAIDTGQAAQLVQRLATRTHQPA
ncbi:MAG: anthranilate phosphoribosyltransferase [Pirellulaceae bacterium]|nr:anthranilate phosphoribosyltransferase [Pirellulaceae bacterium]